MNDTRLNGTLLNRSVLNSTRLNATGIARKAKESVEDRVMKSLVLWYDLKKQGATNESMAADPRIIDHSGNGHHAKCYNFAWAGMSGIGGYNFKDLDLWIKNTNVELNVVTSNKVTILNGNANSNLGIRTDFSQNTFIKIKVEGSSTDNPLAVYKMGDVDGSKRIQTITEDNVYTIGVEFVPNAPYQQIAFACNNITIEQLPLYPNALVSDGVDDYAMVNGLPLIPKDKGFTCIFKMDNNVIEKGFMIDMSKRSSYLTTFAVQILDGKVGPSSYGKNSVLDISYFQDVNVFTKNNFNGADIAVGDCEPAQFLFLFKFHDDFLYKKNVFYKMLLFDRTLTAEEIEWVKTNMIGGEQ